jgi:hypothetical protein
MVLPDVRRKRRYRRALGALHSAQAYPHPVSRLFLRQTEYVPVVQDVVVAPGAATERHLGNRSQVLDSARDRGMYSIRHRTIACA